MAAEYRAAPEPPEAETEAAPHACCCRHKVRTPEEHKALLNRLSRIEGQIRGIRGMVETGDRCPEDMARQADGRKKIWEASTLLLELVNEVLDMGKLESGEIMLEADGQPVSVTSDLLTVRRSHSVGDTIRLTIQRDGQSLTVDVVLYASK